MNSPEKLVSVIICTRNRRALVVRAIDSVFAQEAVPVEVIVVDDCSDDGTPDALKERYGPRLKLVVLEENRRVAHATNRGFDVSSGDYVALLGDDDYWTDTRKLEKQLAAFAQGDATLGLVGTWWKECGDGGEIRAREPREPDDWARQLLKGGGVICGSTPLISRSAWTAAGGLDERMPRGTDSDLFRRIVLEGYTAAVLPVHTTIVDTGHGLSRMTTRGGLAEARRHAFAHAYLLWKYRRQYLRYPDALWLRAKRLVLTPLRALLK